MEEKEITALLNGWEYLDSLPETIDGFILRREIKKNDDSIDIFSYDNKPLHKTLRCFYYSKTSDYMLRHILGMNEYNDIRFITPDLDVFTELLQKGLETVVKSMAVFEREKTRYILAKKGILDWECRDFLPENIGDFVLYVKPSAPLFTINGSFIIIDYSDFEAQKQFVVYYNELRDEFYAEKRSFGIVSTMTLFDARTLKELEEKLVGELSSYLNTIVNEKSVIP